MFNFLSYEIVYSYFKIQFFYLSLLNYIQLPKALEFGDDDKTLYQKNLFEFCCRHKIRGLLVNYE